MPERWVGGVRVAKAKPWRGAPDSTRDQATRATAICPVGADTPHPAVRQLGATSADPNPTQPNSYSSDLLGGSTQAVIQVLMASYARDRGSSRDSTTSWRAPSIAT
ncbi:MAG: hypothetical protein QOD98_4056 [Nocardioidaceae bacterium]|nr:hypothetical protein [Nocardioidaceae bacterium]